MHRAIPTAFLTAAFVLAIAGCESHQSKIDGFQKEYDRLAAQFQKDCSAEYYKVPPTLSPKCAEEKKQMEDAYGRLQAERSKQ